MLHGYTEKFKKELLMQFLAVTYTFNEHTIQSFLSKINEGITKINAD